MFASILSDTLVWGVKVAGRFILGATLMAGGILGFAVASGAIPASEVTLDNAMVLVAEVRAKVSEVTGFWSDLDPSTLGMLASAYGGGMDDAYAGPNSDEASDDYGSLDDFDGFEAAAEGSEEAGY